MAAWGRLRWTLTGLALLALAAALLWGSRPWDEGGVGPGERADPATPAGTVLEGRAAPEPPSVLRTTTGRDGSTCTLRVLARDGGTAAGAGVSYVVCAWDGAWVAGSG